MSFFKNIFSGSSEDHSNTSAKMDWNVLTDLEQLNEIVSLSNQKPVIIFKHSTRCSVSRMALKQFENEFYQAGEVTPYFLDLIAYRAISNAIASQFGVPHQSPQLLLLKNGKSVYDVSHSDISAAALKNKVSFI